MALISCPECKKQISSQAKSCPNCGYPLDNLEKSLQITRPELSSDLSIGKQVVNWGGDAAIKGYFDSQFNTDRSIPDGVGSLLLFKNGIKVTGKFYTPLIDIHFSQIVNIAVVQKDKILDTNNSVLARAAVGTILLGPLGGVIGGMSGIGR
ncbi:MAG: zinc ribbon domain-containing protein, partial [Anaerolineae bacterium]|nr:zinc ribbon domain-containing protein [Anaerolineae bacterium]